MNHEDMRAPTAPIIPSPGPSATLARIAAALNCPPQAFTDQACADLQLAQTAELLQLWLALPDPAARLGVLAFVRDLVARQTL